LLDGRRRLCGADFLLMATLQRPSRLRAMPLEFEVGNALEALQVRSNVQPLFDLRSAICSRSRTIPLAR
jgi:hypothetical protein